jgi:hypothetical protein
MLAAVVLATASPATAAPLDAMRELAGTWHCEYRGGGSSLAYTATYTDDRAAQTVNEVATWAGGGDDEVLAADAQHGGVTAVVLDGQGNATVMRAKGHDPHHIAFRSVYPDATIAVTFDRTSATTYTLHGTVHMGGKTIVSVDTCSRGAR